MKKKRLLLQLSVYNIWLGVLFIGGIVFLVTKIISDYSYDRLHQELESYARVVAAALPQYENNLQALTDHVSKATACRVTLVDKDGIVLTDSSENPKLMENHVNRPEIQMALHGKTGSSKRFSNTLKTEMLYVAVPVHKNDTIPLIVRCSFKVDDISTWLAPFYQTVLLSAVGLGLLGAVAAYLISRRITQPIEEIRVRTSEIANGNFHKRLPPYATGELDSLATGINEMASQLALRMDELARQGEESKGVLENMQEAVISFDANQRLRIVNASAKTLFTINPDYKKLPGQPFGDVFRDETLLSFAEQVVQTADVLEKDLILTQNDDRFLKAFGTPLKSLDGTSQGYLLVFTDMTDIRRLENMRRDFVANVSHELKTPITAIQGALEILEESMGDDEHRRFVDIAHKHSERLAVIIQDILVLSHIESPGRAGEGMRQERVEQVFQQVVDLCREHAEKENKTLRVECPPNTFLTMNPALMEQALVNLVDNAIKYSADSPAITIRCTKKGNRYLLSVIDTGPGIPLPDQARIFERFYRVDKARSRKLGGTGLGLAIVKHIASLHSGTATLESTPGKGCIFTIEIPGGDSENMGGHPQSDETSG